MSQQQQLEDWIEGLAANAGRLRVRAGFRRDPRTIGTLEVPPERDPGTLVDQVLDLADEKAPGWTHLRVDALGEIEVDGRRRVQQLDTWSEVAEDQGTPRAGDQALTALTRALVQSQTEMRRAVGALSTALADSRRMERDAVADALESRLQGMEVAMLADRLQTALEVGGQVEADPLRREVGPVVRQVLETILLRLGGGRPTVEDLRGWRQADPDGFREYVKAAASDPDLREAIAQAMAGA